MAGSLNVVTILNGISWYWTDKEQSKIQLMSPTEHCYIAMRKLIKSIQGFLGLFEELTLCSIAYPNITGENESYRILHIKRTTPQCND